MGKKIVLFMITIAVVWGLVAGIKNVKLEDEEVNNENELVNITSEIYIDELYLPLIELDSLNPLKTSNSQVANILKLIYEPLVEYGSDEKLENILLQEYAKIDSKTYILKLKQNILWHDNEKFNAEDVIFTFNTLKNNAYTYSANLSNIKEINKLDDYSIKIFLENNDDYFIGKLNFPIIPKHYFNNNLNNESKDNKPIGTGAYKYSKVDADENIILDFNTSWWKSSDAKLKKINLYKYASYGEAIKAFKSAKVDMIVTNMSDWKNKFGTIGLNAYSFENSEYEVIIPNCNNLSLKENSVRRAILQAINRANIINSIYEDNAAISDIPVHNNSRNSINNTEYNLEKAKQILINASWEQNENGWQKEINGKMQTLKFNLLVNKESEKKLQVAEKIKNDLNELGIKIDIKSEYFVSEQIMKNSNLNYSNYNSDSMQKIIENMSLNEEKYDENINSFVQLYKNDAPYIGLYFKTSTILTNKSVKGNFEPTWSFYFRNITSFCK